jgi:hypothetical protein
MSQELENRGWAHVKTQNGKRNGMKKIERLLKN